MIISVSDFYVDAKVIGASRHLSVSLTGKFTAVDVIPVDAWRITGDMSAQKNLDVLFALTGKSIFNIPAKYKQAYAFKNRMSIPWRYVMTASDFKKFVNDSLQIIVDAFDTLPFSYHATWIKGEELLQNLQPASIDLFKYAQYANRADYSGPIITFKPPCARPVYDRLSSRTGRMSIKAGPNILTLNKENRNIITSSFKGGQIFYVDFISLEPRLVMLESCSETPDDIYNEFQNEYSLNRDIAKNLVVATIYGAAKTTQASIAGKTHDITHLTNKIESLFHVKQLRDKLANKHTGTHIINRFGRPVVSPKDNPSLFVNTYAQSTGVDVSLLGFHKINKALMSIGAKSLFVLHDGMIIDVPFEAIATVEKLHKVKIESYSSPFPIKVTRIE